MPIQVQSPAAAVTSLYVILSVVGSIATLAFIGLVGTIYLCHTSTDPKLIQAAVNLIQQNPGNLAGALELLHVNPAEIAIVSGLTGTAIGILGGLLGNTRTAPSSSNGNGANNGGTVVTATSTPNAPVTVTTAAPLQ